MHFMDAVAWNYSPSNGHITMFYVNRKSKQFFFIEPFDISGKRLLCLHAESFKMNSAFMHSKQLVALACWIYLGLKNVH